MTDQQRTTMPRPKRRSDLPRLNLPCVMDLLEGREKPDTLTFAAGRSIRGGDTIACLLNGGGTTFIDEEGARQLFIWLGKWLHKPG